ncbi:Harbinger transposase-derived nuclease domain [Phytophthora cactorum]|nr:Harbinger transposase-derived nuclease domain [Phytophthora cactorum]
MHPGFTVKQRLEIGTTIQNAIPPGCDAGFTLSCELLTPYTPREEGRRLSRLQGRYNYIHSATRMATECAFGRLKKRFRLIRSQLEQKSIANCTRYILACHGSTQYSH